ncbi:ribosome biogenesis GTPase YlqF [Sedimenticola thiotaurini]|uniref:Ribosome biogenesis GTPase A n=1 Tax=Sedimenticola thiotaurini TaxID=1543721 RepID=A0A0F7JZF5_9GAMM|nr:ribosome biogenesis GTPase YlqF [Sedimenticola thiotaurini]AKH20724.1 GTPase [Sedimenticola thiotaurini]
MQIQWYPGHMHKASKQIRETLPNVDVIIEVLDARIPFSSTNPMLSTLRGDKPCIKVLNKSDLADPEITQLWQHYLEQEQGVKSLAISCQQPATLKQLPQLCRQLFPAKAGSVKGVHAMIVGIPNVGKSTLINMLANRTIAKTGNEPAITKAQQRINLGDGLILWDTPGVLWPNIENRNSGYRLAATGAIKETAMQNDDVAHFAAEYLLATYAANLRERYRLDQLPDAEYELLEQIGRKRGCLRGGGRVDMEKAGKLLLTELRAGNLGRITLETPQMMAREQEETRRLQAEKAARRAARKARRSSKGK